MRLLMAAVASMLAMVAGGAPTAHADTDSATRYYLSLGDSLATGTNASGIGQAFTDSGYADQLYAALAASDPKLELKKVGCPGESSASLRFGSQPPTTVLSCGSPRFYKNVLYSKGTQLAEAVGLLEAHKGKVALVTIDIGANDLARIDENGDVVSCLFEFAGCVAQQASMEANLSAVLAALRTAAGPDVPIVGMTYYNVYLPLDDPVVDARVSSTNALLASTYAAAGVAVADVAGAFPTTDDVCSFTWFCTDLDVHPNAAGYGVIADEFLKVLP